MISMKPTNGTYQAINNNATRDFIQIGQHDERIVVLNIVNIPATYDLTMSTFGTVICPNVLDLASKSGVVLLILFKMQPLGLTRLGLVGFRNDKPVDNIPQLFQPDLEQPEFTIKHHSVERQSRLLEPVLARNGKGNAQVAELTAVTNLELHYVR